jgi:hypothetical protein
MAVKTLLFLVRDCKRRFKFLVYARSATLDFPFISSAFSFDRIPFWAIQVLLDFRKEDVKTNGIWVSV